MASDNEWAHKFLDTAGPDFYGEMTFEFKAGNVRKVSVNQTHVAPDIHEQRDRAAEKSQPKKRLPGSGDEKLDAFEEVVVQFENGGQRNGK